MISKRARMGLLVLLGLFAVSVIVTADGAMSPLGIVPTPTPTPLSASLWTDKATYVIGENVTIFFNVSQPSYIYVYDIQPDGVVRLIFPNAYSQANYVSAGTHSLPDGMYKFTVAPPAGTEQLQLFASPIPLGLSPSSYGEPFPMVGPDPGSAGGNINAQIMGIVPVPNWVTAWTSFVIMGTSYGYTPPTQPPSGYPYPPFYPPFYGYPGGTWYWQDGSWHFGTPNSGWYWYFGDDGKWHFRIVIRLGTGN